jgi:hypothetical protein
LLPAVYYQDHHIKENEIVGACKTHGGKPEGKRPLGRPRCRWDYNIKIDIKEIGLEGVDWIHLDQGRDRWWALVNTVMNLWVP